MHRQGSHDGADPDAVHEPTACWPLRATRAARGRGERGGTCGRVRAGEPCTSRARQGRVRRLPCPARRRLQDSSGRPDFPASISWSATPSGTSSSPRSSPTSSSGGDADHLDSLIDRYQPDVIVHEVAEFAGLLVATAHGIPYVDLSYGSLIGSSLLRAAGEAAAPHWRARGLEPHPVAGLFRYLYVDTCPPSLQSPEIASVAAVQRLRPAAAERPDVDPPDWLDRLDSAAIVYLTMGTVWNRNLDVFRTVIEAVRDEDIALIVTVGRHNDPASLGPQPDDVLVHQYIPQGVLLPRCDAVITHGGSGTLLVLLNHVCHHRLRCLGWTTGWTTRTPAAEPPGVRAELDRVAGTRSRSRARRCRRGASDRHPHRPSAARDGVQEIQRQRAGPRRARSVPNGSAPCRVRRRRSRRFAGQGSRATTVVRSDSQGRNVRSRVLAASAADQRFRTGGRR